MTEQELKDKFDIVRRQHQSVDAKRGMLEEAHNEIIELRKKIKYARNSTRKNRLRQKLHDAMELKDSLEFDLILMHRREQEVYDLIVRIPSQTDRLIMEQYYLNSGVPTLSDVANELNFSHDYVRKRKRMGFLSILEFLKEDTKRSHTN